MPHPSPSTVLAVVTDAGHPAPVLLAAQVRKRHGGRVHVVHGPLESLPTTAAAWVVGPDQLAARLSADTGREVIGYDPAGTPASWSHLLQLTHS